MCIFMIISMNMFLCLLGPYASWIVVGQPSGSDGWWCDPEPMLATWILTSPWGGFFQPSLIPYVTPQSDFPLAS